MLASGLSALARMGGAVGWQGTPPPPASQVALWPPGAGQAADIRAAMTPSHHWPLGEGGDPLLGSAQDSLPPTSDPEAESPPTGPNAPQILQPLPLPARVAGAPHPLLQARLSQASLGSPQGPPRFRSAPTFRLVQELLKCGVRTRTKGGCVLLGAGPLAGNPPPQCQCLCRPGGMGRAGCPVGQGSRAWQVRPLRSLTSPDRRFLEEGNHPLRPRTSLVQNPTERASWGTAAGGWGRRPEARAWGRAPAGGGWASAGPFWSSGV